MKSLWILTSCFLVLISCSESQLAPAEKKILFRVQQLLEYPLALQSWNNWTNFCFLPPTDSLTVVCSGNHVTELIIAGNKSSPSMLSSSFSLESFFTVLTKLNSLRKLSLVSLGLWGPLPAKVDRLRSLRALNLSSNFISGEIPPEITRLSSLEDLDLSNNNLGPEFPSLGDNLVRILLGNNSLRSEIPESFKNLNRVQVLDLSFNKLVGPIPGFLFSLPSIAYVSLGKNHLSGGLSSKVSCGKNLRFVDLSSNLMIGELPWCLLSTDLGNKTVVIMFNCLSNTTSKYQRPRAYCQKEALAVEPPAEARIDIEARDRACCHRKCCRGLSRSRAVDSRDL